MEVAVNRNVLADKAHLSAFLSLSMLSSLTPFARNPRQFALTMSRHLYLDSSPPQYHGPRDVLDKSAFQKSLSVLAVRVSPEKTRVLLKASELKK